MFSFPDRNPQKAPWQGGGGHVRSGMLSGRGAGDQCPILVVTLALPDSDKGPVLAEKLLKVRGGGFALAPRLPSLAPTVARLPRKSIRSTADDQQSSSTNLSAESERQTLPTPITFLTHSSA